MTDHQMDLLRILADPNRLSPDLLSGVGLAERIAIRAALDDIERLRATVDQLEVERDAAVAEAVKLMINRVDLTEDQARFWTWKAIREKWPKRREEAARLARKPQEDPQP